ncbi:MAG: hypothetical protein MUP13_01840 [Thermoanaerobaculales bacterium]|nr:hypothetical protein [Thermoanaerobaculales bacterium]
MAAPYCGVPTRIGRIMMAAFGAPFILSAGFLLGSAIFGDDEGGVSNGFLQYSWGNANELLGRIAFGAGAIFLIVITAIGWWKYLRGRW